jgi:hypothetical protein
MLLIPILLAWTLIYYAGKHTDSRLKLACYISALFYCLYVPLESIDMGYATAYNLYMAIDMVWAASLFWVRAPNISIMVGLWFVLYGAVLVHLPVDNVFYRNNEVCSLLLHAAMVLSLTILPEKFKLSYRSRFSSSDNSNNLAIVLPLSARLRRSLS